MNYINFIDMLDIDKQEEIKNRFNQKKRIDCEKETDFIRKVFNGETICDETIQLIKDLHEEV